MLFLLQLLLLAPIVVSFLCSNGYRSQVDTRMSLGNDRKGSDGSSSSSSSSSKNSSLDEVERYLMQRTLARRPVQKTKRNLKANVMWRAIPMEDLRRHPLYTPLNENGPEIISSTKDLSKFRQSSYQWNILHAGRLTTSMIAGGLGLLESKASTYLGIPKSLRGSKAVQAVYNLLDDPIEDYNSLLNIDNTSQASGHTPDTSPWKIKIKNKIEKYAKNAHCVYRPARSATNSTKRLMSSVTEAKLSWGSYQEATAILVALNYFKETAVVSEVGLNAFETLLLDEASSNFLASEWLQIKQWVATGQLPLLGSSPDGMINHRNGTIECLEVKCLSPFTLGTDKKSISLKTYVPDKVATFHIPQLMFHMLCSDTSSTVLVTLTAQKGARIYRVHRNNELIMLMLHFVKLFYTSYVVPMRTARSKLPSSDNLLPRNFFFDRPSNSTENLGYTSDDTDKYHRYLLRSLTHSLTHSLIHSLSLLHLIKESSDHAELLADIEQDEVQRSPGREDLLE